MEYYFSRLVPGFWIPVGRICQVTKIKSWFIRSWYLYTRTIILFWLLDPTKKIAHRIRKLNEILKSSKSIYWITKGLCNHFSLVKVNCVYWYLNVFVYYCWYGEVFEEKIFVAKRTKSYTFSKTSSPLLLTDQSLILIIYAMFLCLTD